MKYILYILFIFYLNHIVFYCLFFTVHENGDNFRTDKNDSNSYNKFIWEDVIKSLLNASYNNELSLKKMTKKIVKEYQNSFSDEKSYDEVAKILNKKLRKLPFVTISKEKVILCT